MNIIDDNKKLNELITNGFYMEVFPGSEDALMVSLKNKKVYIEEFKVGDHMDTIDKRMNALSMEARRSYFIETMFKTVGINLNDIEKEFNILCTSETYVVLMKRLKNGYKFIEFINDKYCDEAKKLSMVELDLDTNYLIYDRIDFNELKYYHKRDKISKFTLDLIKNNWELYSVTQNNLYDVIAEGVVQPKYDCAWTAMDDYGDFTQNINPKTLNRSVCYVEERHKKNRVYYK